MSTNHTGNVEPSVDLEEHRSIGGVNAKAVVPYTFDGTNLVPSSSGVNSATRTDSATTTNVTYVGKAAPGSATSAAVWQILVLDETVTNTLAVKWAGGSSAFNQVWDNRAGLAYS